MKTITLENGKTVTFNKNGAIHVTPNNGLFDITQIPWDMLLEIIKAASMCKKEGTREHDDLLQAAYDYLPALRKRVTDD